MSEPNHPARPTDDGTARNDQLLLEFLKSNDASCPVCGYNVRGLTRPVCPECEHRLHLRIGADDVPLKWFLAAIAPGISSGIAGILLASALILESLTGKSPVPGFVYAIDAFGLASGVLAVIMMTQRTRIVAMEIESQRALAAVIWVVHSLAFLAVLSTVI